MEICRQKGKLIKRICQAEFSDQQLKILHLSHCCDDVLFIFPLRNAEAITVETALIHRRFGKK